MTSAAVAAVLTGVPVNGAWASSFGNDIDDMLGELMPISSAELAAHRGGMKVGQYEISFTVNVQSTIINPNLPSVGPVVVETGFALNDQTGNLSSLGTTIRNQVQQEVQNKLESSGISSPALSQPPAPVGPAGGVGAGAPTTSKNSTGSAPSPVPSGSTSIKSAPIVVDNQLTGGVIDAAQSLENTVSGAIQGAQNAVLSGTSGAPAAKSGTPTTTSGITSTGPTTKNGPSQSTNLPGSSLPSAGTSNSQQDTSKIDVAAGAINASSNGGSVAIDSGFGSRILSSTEKGHLTLIENTADNVVIQSRITANYKIENFGSIARRAAGISQVNNVSRQLVHLNTLGLD